MNTVENMKCPLMADYQTPAGYYDTPFLYVWEPYGLNLAGGASYFDLAVPIESDSDFILRSCTGLKNVVSLNTGKWQLKDSNRRYISSAPMTWQTTHPFVPEIPYAASTQIAFDLYGIAIGTNANGQGGTNPNYGQLVFQGVRRFRGSRNSLGQSDYRYYTRPYQYVVTVTVNNLAFVDMTVPGSPQTSPQQCVQPINDYDFELQYISAVNQNDLANISETDFKLQLYDQDQHALFSKPVTMYYLESRTAADYELGVFPVPSILYKRGSQFKFDIQSLLTFGQTTSPAVYQFNFVGNQRIPY